MDTFTSPFDPQLLSIHTLLEHEPSMMKNIVAHLLNKQPDSAEAAKQFTRTCFLYFF